MTCAKLLVREDLQISLDLDKKKISYKNKNKNMFNIKGSILRLRHYNLEKKITLA